MAQGAARQRLVEQHADYVRAVVARLVRQVGEHVEFDELLSMGTTGLLEAADRFDDAAGVAFTTFAHYRIRGAILDGLRKMGHLPRRAYARARAAERTDTYLEAQATTDATARRATGRGAASVEDELRSMYDALRGAAAIYVTSLEAESDKGAQFSDTAITAEERVALTELRGAIATAIAALPDRERHFIQKHYFEDKSLLEAGQELGLSKSWSSRLHARAVDLIRDRLQKQHAI